MVTCFALAGRMAATVRGMRSGGLRFFMVGQADQRSGHLDGCRDSGNRPFFHVALAAIG